MKNNLLSIIAPVLAIGSFLFLAAVGMTAETTMIGMTILVVWAAASMLVLELRSPILEAEAIERPAPRHTRLERVANDNLLPMPAHARRAA